MNHRMFSLSVTSDIIPAQLKRISVAAVEGALSSCDILEVVPRANGVDDITGR